jgi:hypothetical protein
MARVCQPGENAGIFDVWRRLKQNKGKIDVGKS